MCFNLMFFDGHGVPSKIWGAGGGGAWDSFGGHYPLSLPYFEAYSLTNRGLLQKIYWTPLPMPGEKAPKSNITQLYEDREHIVANKKMIPLLAL